METSEYGNTNLNAIIQGDKDFAFESSESFAKMGFTKQEFNEETGDLEDIEEEEDIQEDDDIYSDEELEELDIEEQE